MQGLLPYVINGISAGVALALNRFSLKPNTPLLP